jgi:RNA polymerase sigma-70 factor (ECF subfamily)
MESDRELLVRWGANDATAGEQLFTRHFDAVLRFFVHRAPEEAQELVQQTFLGALAARERFRGEASFRTFLFAIARRQLLKHFASRGSRSKLVFRTMSLADLQTSADTRIANSDLQARLLAHMHELPVDQQLVLELHYWEGMRVRDVAEVVDAPEGTVKRWMYEARRTLADKLALDERGLKLGPPPVIRR